MATFVPHCTDISATLLATPVENTVILPKESEWLFAKKYGITANYAPTVRALKPTFKEIYESKKRLPIK